MEINANFDELAFEHGAGLPWQASPMAGVSRRMLDRVGDEVARATSIVRYDPGSSFSPHVHSGGEEFLVLSGVFQDEHGDFPAGTYVRNPINTSHTPASAEGCEIFVKLWQFHHEESEILNVDINAVELTGSNNPEISAALLYQDQHEVVSIEQWQAGSTLQLQEHGGAEWLVLSGSFMLDDEEFQTHSWLRVPPASAGHPPGNPPVTVQVGTSGAHLWKKSGHLNHIVVPG